MYVVYHSTASIMNMVMKMAYVINSLPLSVDINMFSSLRQVGYAYMRAVYGPNNIGDPAIS